MPLRTWQKLKESTVSKNPWWTYKKDSFALPTGEAGEYHYVHTNGSSMIVPIFAGGKVLMVKQYRYLCDRESLEFPCGSVKDGTTYEQTAQMELAEEAGLAAESFVPLGEFNPYNGITDEMCKVYFAKNLSPVQAKPDLTEEFELLHLTVEEIEEKIRIGEIWDGMTLAAWLLARQKLST